MVLVASSGTIVGNRANSANLSATIKRDRPSCHPAPNFLRDWVKEVAYSWGPQQVLPVAEPQGYVLAQAGMGIHSGYLDLPLGPVAVLVKLPLLLG